MPALSLVRFKIKKEGETTYAELVQDCSESGEEPRRFLVAGDEAFGIADDDGGEDRTLHALAHTLEVVGDADELLHLAEVFGFDLLKGRSELKPLLPEMPATKYKERENKTFINVCKVKVT